MALSPKWTKEVEDVPELVKDAEKDPKKKIKRDTIQGMMESGGYDSKGAALFSEDKADPTSPISPIKENMSFGAPSVSDVTSVPTNAEVAAQAGLKWQGCQLLFSQRPMDLLTYYSHNPAHA
jgi:hypothetical protein